MKTTRTNKIVRMAMAVAWLAGTGGIAIAGGTSEPQSRVAKVIELHAPNNATQSITVWTPKATVRSAGSSKAAESTAPKVIELHAPNNPTPSITIWTGE